MMVSLLERSIWRPGDRVLAQVYLRVGPVNSMCLFILFLVPEHIISMDIMLSS